MKLFFFDTETTGLDSDDQILQFGGIYGSFDGKEFTEERRINQYINVTKDIHPEAERVHGIKKNMIDKFGYIDEYIDEILGYIKKADYVIGHNLDFDIKMLKQECKRIGKGFDRDNVKSICTMKKSIDILNLPGGKRPKLSELYKHLFGKDFDDAHNAMADVEATKDCFIELLKEGHILSIKPTLYGNKSKKINNKGDIYTNMKKIYLEPDEIDTVNGDDKLLMVDNDNVLLKAIDYENIETIERIVEGGANINAKDKYGITVLMSAFYNPSVDYNGIKRLIELGANVNARNKSGKTTFMEACDARCGNNSILDLLIQNGADINAKDNSGLTALSHVIESGGSKILAKFLKSRGCFDSRSIFTKIMSNYWW